MTVAELIEQLSQLESDWTVEIGYEGTTGTFEDIGLYPDGFKATQPGEEWRKQQYRDRGEEVPDPLPEPPVYYLIPPKTVVLRTH